ncbi:MAG: hypothetical protein KC474_06675 [Cyanobacteria bacterium HKST-UBA04]|nr:hypothetical protein [Cyanobacteria bacterium HKST-UBA04]
MSVSLSVSQSAARSVSSSAVGQPRFGELLKIVTGRKPSQYKPLKQPPSVPQAAVIGQAYGDRYGEKTPNNFNIPIGVVMWNGQAYVLAKQEYSQLAQSVARASDDIEYGLLARAFTDLKDGKFMPTRLVTSAMTMLRSTPSGVINEHMNRLFGERRGSVPSLPVRRLPKGQRKDLDFMVFF